MKEIKTRGRPPKCKKPISIVGAVQLIRRINEERFGGDPILVEKKSKSKKTLYNMIWKHKLKNYGDRHCVILDEEEIRALCG